MKAETIQNHPAEQIQAFCDQFLTEYRRHLDSSDFPFLTEERIKNFYWLFYGKLDAISSIFFDGYEYAPQAKEQLNRIYSEYLEKLRNQNQPDASGLPSAGASGAAVGQGENFCDSILFDYGSDVIWYQQRTNGGKQAVPAQFITYRGVSSALISVNGVDHIVRLSNIKPGDSARSPAGASGSALGQGDNTECQKTREKTINYFDDIPDDAYTVEHIEPDPDACPDCLGTGLDFTHSTEFCHCMSCKITHQPGNPLPSFFGAVGPLKPIIV
jgi:hypothetical protein